MPRYTVTLNHLGSRAHTETARVEVAEEWEAKIAGIKALYGPRAGWFADGIGPRYGQVIEPAGQQASRTLTGRARIDVVEGWEGG
jgi:hypothetical protein